MSEHAWLSPSGSRQWLACPGSLTLTRGMPDASNEAADEGTAMHTVAAWCLTEHWRASKRIGEYIVVSSEGEARRAVLFDEDMAELTQGYVDTVRNLGIGHTLLIETRVDFSEYVQVPKSFGTVDAGIIDVKQAELFVIDLKTGWKFVEVESNTQLLLYALGLYRTVELQYNIETIRLGIYQPKHGGMREWKCTVGELLTFADFARSKAASVLLAEQTYDSLNGHSPTEKMREWEDTFLNSNPNEQDCMFCRAMATCPAMARKVQQVIGDSFEVIAEPSKNIPIAKRMPIKLQETEMRASPAAAADELATMMAASGMIEDWIKAVRSEVERRLLLDGQAVPGWGLETGREGNRRWADPEQAEAYLRQTVRLKLEDAFNLKLKSPTQVEEMTKRQKVVAIVGDPVVSELPALIGKRQWATLQANIVRNPPKPSVKSASAIRKPYVLPAPDADDFSTVEESTPLSDLA